MLTAGEAFLAITHISSSAKISHVSRPASRATSIPSPPIQRATAIVELMLIRSKLP
jgi:hypothetical protein